MSTSDIYVAKKYARKYDNAKLAGTEFSLTIEEFKSIVSKDNCFYTGVKMNKPIGENSNDWHDLTLDRIDNSKGYVSGNVVACTKAANNLKSIWENPQFKLTPQNALDIASKAIRFKDGVGIDKGVNGGTRGCLLSSVDSLSARAVNALSVIDIRTVDDLLDKKPTFKELSRVPNCGEGTAKSILSFMESVNVD